MERSEAQLRAEAKYRAANREACNARTAAWEENNRERKYAQRNAWRDENRERVNENLRASRARQRAADPAAAYLKKRAQHLKYKYGISLETYDAMLDAQGGRCAICPTTEPSRYGFHVDHDHGTSIVRGLLCKNCNPMIGHAREDCGILAAAIAYIETHSATQLSLAG